MLKKNYDEQNQKADNISMTTTTTTIMATTMTNMCKHHDDADCDDTTESILQHEAICDDHDFLGDSVV